MRKLVLFTGLVISLSCSSSPKTGKTAPTYFTSKMTDSRFHTADHFLASIEMQISGEPFAQLLGRNLAFYDRTSVTPGRLAI